jgi:SAM-dependent methyltransferase
MYLRPLRRSEVDAVVMHLPVRPGGRLLDIGCGRGDGLRELAAAGWRAEGLDIDPATVALARGRGLDVRLGTLADQAYPSSAFDAVTMSHAIEHVADPASVLGEIHRILAPGGRLAILTPNGRSPGHRWFGSCWFALDPPRHLHLFTLPALSRLLARTGFHVTCTFTSERGAHLILSASRSIQRTGRAGLAGPSAPGIAAWARAAQWLEWVGSRVVGPLGEEIVAVAEKPGGHASRATASRAAR